MLRPLAILTLAAAAAAQGMNPCHAKRYLSKEPACEGIKMPPALGHKCILRAPKDDGQFVNCSNIYDLDNPGCKEAFQAYVALNPCDKVRAGYVARWGEEDAMVALDYFAYALLEQCCDNVEAGSKVEEYQQRNAAKTLWSLQRGNGPAHLNYDITGLIFPNLRYFDLGGKPGTWAGPHPEWPKIKGPVEAWQASPASKNWVYNANADIPWEIKRLLNHAMYALECHNYNTWARCVDLEAKQNRV